MLNERSLSEGKTYQFKQQAQTDSLRLRRNKNANGGGTKISVRHIRIIE